MKPNKIIYPVFAVFMAGFACGCSDSDDWTPGEHDTATGAVAYFVQPAQTSYIFDAEKPTSEYTFDVIVNRKNTAEAAEVPLSLETKATGITIPPTVSFAAGESQAVFTVSCAGIEGGKYDTFSIALSDDHTDIYGAGLEKVSFSVIKSSWLVIADNVRYIYNNAANNQIYPSTYGKMYNLEGTKQFRLDDFLGSGLAVEFECYDPANSTFIPLNNADFNSLAGEPDDPWYVFDDAANDWPMWVPGNADGYPAVGYLEFFATNDYSPGKMISDAATLYGYYMLMGGLTYTDGSFTWAYITFDFTLNYNPFE